MKYDEVQEDKIIRTTMKLGHEKALIMRAGAVSMRLPLNIIEQQKGHYESEFGSMPLVIDTKNDVYKTGNKRGFPCTVRFTNGWAIRWQLYIRYYIYGGTIMNAVEQVQQAIKVAIVQAVEKAGLVEAGTELSIHPKHQRIKQMVTMQQTLRCN